MAALEELLRLPNRSRHWEHAWKRLTTGDALLCALCEAVRTGSVGEVVPLLDTWQEFATKQGKWTRQQWHSAHALLACAHPALAAKAFVTDENNPPVDGLIPLLHAVAEVVGSSCNHAVDHGALHMALTAQHLFGTGEATGRTLTPARAVDIVFRFLAGRGSRFASPGRLSWAWDVTRILLNTPRRVVGHCAIPVAGTEGNHGFLATLTLEVMEPGCGEVFHDPHDAFHTHADPLFDTAMRDAWRGACWLTQGQGMAVGTWDGRWRLRRGVRPVADGPPMEANDRSASGAAARGWRYAFTGEAPDARVAVLAQVDAENVTHLKGVDGVFAKTQAIAATGRAALSETPRTALDLITPAYVRHKVGTRQAVGPVLDDLQTAVSIAVDQKDLVSAFRFGLLKAYLVASSTKPLLGAEAALRVRLGESERALAEVEYLGSLDDRLLVSGELALQAWDRDPALAQEQLQRIRAMALQASPEVVELVATRLAEVNLPAALALAKRIPEPAWLNDYLTGIENPTAGRCIFQVLRTAVRRNLPRAVELVEMLPEGSDKVQAYVALGTAIVLDQPSKAFELCQAAIAHLPDEKYREALPYFFARYVLGRIPDMDLERSLAALQGIGELFCPLLFLPGFAEVVDAQIKKSPAWWKDTLAGLPAGAARDFIRWRLMALGHVPFAEPAAFEDDGIQEFVQATKIIDIAAEHPREAVEMAEGLTTLLGYARAIAGIAERIQAHDPATAQRLLTYACSSKSLESGWFGFNALLELLKVALRVPGDTRREILAACINRAAKLEPEDVRSGAHLAIGGVLGNALLQAVPHEADFFRALMLECDTERSRKLVASLLLRNLPEAQGLCTRIAHHRAAFGLVTAENLSEHADAALFLPETQAELLTCLADRLINHDVQLASECLLSAADFSAVIEDEEDRNAAAWEVIYYALQIAPSFVWQVYPRCGGSRFALHPAIEHLLGAYAGSAGDAYERFLRLYLEHLLASGDYETGLEHRRYVNKRLLALETLRLPPLGESLSNGGRLSPAWMHDLPNYIARYLEHFTSESCYWSDPPKIAKRIAQLDWTTFMAIVRHPHIGRPATHGLTVKDLWVSLLKLEADPRQLLDDLTAIQNARESESKQVDLVDNQFCGITVAAAAAYDPEACLEMVATLPAGSRLRFVDHLEDFTPEQAWTEQHVSRLFGLWEASEDTDAVLIAEANMLRWLGQRFATFPTFVQKVARGATALEHCSRLCDVIRHLRRIDARLSNALLDPALTRAVERCDAGAIVEALNLDKDTSLPPEVCLRALQVARNADAATENRWQLRHIAEHQARLKPEEALTTLGLMKPDDSDLWKVLATIADAIPVMEEHDIDRWVSRISDLQNLSAGHKSYFVWCLIKRGIGTGVISSPRTFQYITYIVDKVDALLTLSARLDEPEQCAVLAQACHEAEGADSAVRRESAFRRLAEFYMGSDQQKALAFYKGLLLEAKKSDRALMFVFTIEELAKVCFLLATKQAHELAVQIDHAVREFPYGRNPHDFMDAKAHGLIGSALAFWSCDKSQAVGVLQEAVTEYLLYLEAVRPVVLVLGHHVRGAAYHLATQQGLASAKEMLSILVEPLPYARRQEVADSIANGFRNYSGEDDPLSQWGLRYMYRLPAIHCALLQHLVPLCSPSAACEVHLALGISAWGRDQRTARQEIARAASIAETARETPKEYHSEAPYSSKSLYMDVWRAYAAAEGLDGCLHAARVLSLEPDLLQRTGPDLLRCAIGHVPDKAAFLRDLWAALQALRAYA